jgi:hypothetical protein
MSYTYTLSTGATRTAADLIRRALKLLGVLAAGEPLPAEDQADGLVELNLLLGTWANERLLLYGTRRASYTLTPGLSPHEIGAGSAFAATRPIRIEGAGIIRAGQTTETPLDVLTDSEYRGISEKALTADVPQRLWVEWTHPTANLWLWPVPTTAATLVLYTWSQLDALEATDRVDLPPGYENALAHALALQWAPMYGVEPGAALVNNAETAIAAIKRANQQPAYLRSDPAMLRAGFNIKTG